MSDFLNEEKAGPYLYARTKGFHPFPEMINEIQRKDDCAGSIVYKKEASPIAGSPVTIRSKLPATLVKINVNIAE